MRAVFKAVLWLLVNRLKLTDHGAPVALAYLVWAWEMVWVGVLAWIIKKKPVFQALQADNSGKGQPVAFWSSSLRQHARRIRHFARKFGPDSFGPAAFHRWRLLQNGAEAADSHAPPPSLPSSYPSPCLDYSIWHCTLSFLGCLYMPLGHRLAQR